MLGPLEILGVYHANLAAAFAPVNDRARPESGFAAPPTVQTPITEHNVPIVLALVARHLDR
jgi:hypothetical protein